MVLLELGYGLENELVGVMDFLERMPNQFAGLGRKNGAPRASILRRKQALWTAGGSWKECLISVLALVGRTVLAGARRIRIWLGKQA